VSVDVLQVWKDELENLPKVANSSWAGNFANWTGDRVDAAAAQDGVGIATDPAALVGPSGNAIVFSFNRSQFETGLLSLSPTTDAVAGITGFANAWEAALLASTATGIPASYIPPASPSTTFSSITSTTIDPASIALGKAKILELIGSPPVASGQDSQFPIKFREAFLLLTVTVVGQDSSSNGPFPLTAAAVPLT